MKIPHLSKPDANTDAKSTETTVRRVIGVHVADDGRTNDFAAKKTDLAPNDAPAPFTCDPEGVTQSTCKPWPSSSLTDRSVRRRQAHQTQGDGDFSTLTLGHEAALNRSCSSADGS